MESIKVETTTVHHLLHFCTLLARVVVSHGWSRTVVVSLNESWFPSFKLHLRKIIPSYHDHVMWKWIETIVYSFYRSHLSDKMMMLFACCSEATVQHTSALSVQFFFACFSPLPSFVGIGWAGWMDDSHDSLSFFYLVLSDSIFCSILFSIHDIIYL